MAIRELAVNLKSSKYMCIDKSESENPQKMVSRVQVHINMRRDIKHAINISMDKTSCTISDYGFTGLIRQGDNPNKETLIYIPHISCRHHLSLYNLSYPQSNQSVSVVIIVPQKSCVIKQGVNSGHNTITGEYKGVAF